MPIKIRDVPDPFTGAARFGTDRPLRIESDAYRQLVHELRRYCSGEVAGRSFLIAGHRGAGKTTLVSSAFDELLREKFVTGGSTGSGTRPVMTLRPLPVLLQGPTLLPGSKEDLPLAVDGTGEAGRRLTEMENVLVQIILGLHRAVAAEMVTAFREHVWNVTRQKRFDAREILELAAHVQLELDDYTSKARLRDLWRRGEALTHGVLYALEQQSRPLRDDVLDAPISDQGVRELVALASVCDAYRRISGKINRKDERRSDVTGKTERSAEIDAKGKDIAGPIIAALTGGAVGTATLAGTGNAQVATLAGILTALAGMVAGKVSFSQKQERSITSEDLFIPDLSVATMDRILPVLLDRLRSAGLAPVFVIDELDKVEGLSDRILGMIRRLKKIVAENACFCFLADRSYFEEMRQRTAASPYSIEHTYFTHQLFVAFRHADIRRFLEQILVRPAEPAPDPARAGAAPQPIDPKLLSAIREDQTDHDLLPYILLHSAQMHPIDLMRQIAQLRSADGNVILAPGAVRSQPRYLLELLVQLAIELQLEQKGMQEELDRRPAFRRLAHDALYYLSRKWEEDADAPLSLGDDGREEFESYLVRRMALESRLKKADESAPKPSAARRYVVGEVEKPPEETAPKPMPISGEDTDFLWNNVKDLAQKLATPATIYAEYDKRGTAQTIIAALEEAIKLGSLLEPQGQDVYGWRFRRSGRATHPPAPPVAPATAQPQAAQPAQPEQPEQPEQPPPPPQPPAWRASVVTIRQFEDALLIATEGAIDPSVLSTGLGILPTSPAWPPVSAALARLESVKDKPAYPEMPEDEVVVNAYAAMVESHVPAVALAIYCAKALSARVGGLRAAIEKISQLFGFHEVGAVLVMNDLQSLYTGLAALAGGPERPTGTFSDSVDWIRRVGEWSVKSYDFPPISNENTTEGWEYWRWRLGESQDRPVATREVLQQAIKGSGAFTFLKLPLEAMTLRDWSLLFFRAAFFRPATVEAVPPEWIGPPALRRLGWGDGNLRNVLDMKIPGVEPSDLIRAPRVFICTYDGAASETWSYEPGCAVLALRIDEWDELQSAWLRNSKDLMNAFSANIVALDLQESERGPGRERLKPGGSPAAAGKKFFKWFRLEKTVQVVIGNKAKTGDTRFGYRQIIGPTSLSDFVKRVMTHASSNVA